MTIFLSCAIPAIILFLVVGYSLLRSASINDAHIDKIEEQRRNAERK